MIILWINIYIFFPHLYPFKLCLYFRWIFFLFFVCGNNLNRAQTNLYITHQSLGEKLLNWPHHVHTADLFPDLFIWVLMSSSCFWYIWLLCCSYKQMNNLVIIQKYSHVACWPNLGKAQQQNSHYNIRNSIKVEIL